MTIKEQKALLIEQVVLTDQEKEAAILEGKRRKFFKEKHKAYWEAYDSIRKENSGSTDEMPIPSGVIR